MTGTELIAQERQRQIEVEGFTDDSGHSADTLILAAMCYLGNRVAFDNEFTAFSNLSAESWPFDDDWWKPTTPIRDLTKAGALIAAEIDRRLAKEKNQVTTG